MDYGIVYIVFVVSADSVNCFKNRLDNFLRTIRIISGSASSSK